MTVLGQGLVMALFFAIPAGVILMALDSDVRFNQGFVWGAIACAVFCAWLGPKIGSPRG